MQAYEDTHVTISSGIVSATEMVATCTQNGSFSYLTLRTAAQDGNLITCLNKSQFKLPRGLAFCLDKPLDHAYLLQGCSRQFNTREWS